MGERGLADELGDRLLEKGRELLNRGEVLFYNSTDTEATAVVSGCEVRIFYDWEGDNLKFKCGCHKKARACEHTAALMLKVLQEGERYDRMTGEISSRVLWEGVEVPVSLPRFEGTALAVFVAGYDEDYIRNHGPWDFLKTVSLAERMGVRDPVAIGLAAEKLIRAFGGKPEKAVNRILEDYGDYEEDLTSILRLFVRASCMAPTDGIRTTLRLMAERMGIWERIEEHLKGCG